MTPRWECLRTDNPIWKTEAQAESGQPRADLLLLPLLVQKPPSILENPNVQISAHALRRFGERAPASYHATVDEWIRSAHRVGPSRQPGGWIYRMGRPLRMRPIVQWQDGGWVVVTVWPSGPKEATKC